MPNRAAFSGPFGDLCGLGTLDLLVLRTLTRGPRHGYGIVLHIQQVSDGALRVEEGSLYPALHRMEQAGWIDAEWKLSESNRRAKHYKLTRAGRDQLEKEEQKWQRITNAVGQFLKFA